MLTGCKPMFHLLFDSDESKQEFWEATFLVYRKLQKWYEVNLLVQVFQWSFEMLRRVVKRHWKSRGNTKSFHYTHNFFEEINSMFPLL